MSDSPLRPSVAEDLGSLAGAYAPSEPSPELSGGTMVGGHFVIETTLGRGGMGAVYRAHDRQLDRKVAIKLGLRGADLARARREAVALARLAHPNVVTIHEIGEHDGVPFVAMELCEGGHVRAWARAAPRTWREILRVYLDAGRGLAAAHAAGLVHRDVKPDNILLGSDGRARIADFGLARGAQGLVGGSGVLPQSDANAATAAAAPTEQSVVDVEAPTVGVSSSSPSWSSDPNSTLTEHGAVVGTPRYMAPEQTDGRPLDERTDEYAFCVALKETLGDKAPRRVAAILARGASREPSSRFPTMDSLIAALERATRRSRWWIAPAILALAGAIALTWSLARGRAAPPAGCESAAARVKKVWNPEIRRELLARGPHLATFVDTIDARITSWTLIRAQTCHDVRRGGEAAAAGFAALECLDQRLADLDTVVGYVRNATISTHAAELPATVPAASICRDRANLAVRQPQPDTEELRDQVARARSNIVVAYGLDNVGEFDAAMKLVDAVPRGIFAPLDAEAELLRADILGESNELDASKQAYRSAIKLATASHHARVQVEALLDLAITLAQENEDLDERSRAEVNGMFELAEATIASIGGNPELEAHFHGNRAAVRTAFGDLEGGVADAREAVRLRRVQDGPHAGATLNATINLGASLLSAGHPSEGRQVLAAALEDADTYLHPNHNITRHLCDLLASAELRLGNLAAARTLRERALRMSEAMLRPGDVQLDEERLNLSALLANEGKFDETVPLIQQTLENLRARGEERSTDAAMLHGNLAMSLSLTGHQDEALAETEQAISIFETSLGKDHPLIVEAWITQAMILRDKGDEVRATAIARHALEVAEHALPPTSPDLANPLGTLAMIIAETSPAEARRLAERALALSAPPDGSPSVRGEAELALAMALAHLDQQTRAMSLGAQAVATLTEAGPMAGSSRKRAEAWLAAHQKR